MVHSMVEPNTCSISKVYVDNSEIEWHLSVDEEGVFIINLGMIDGQLALLMDHIYHFHLLSCHYLFWDGWSQEGMVLTAILKTTTMLSLFLNISFIHSLYQKYCQSIKSTLYFHPYFYQIYKALNPRIIFSNFSRISIPSGTPEHMYCCYYCCCCCCCSLELTRWLTYPFWVEFGLHPGDNTHRLDHHFKHIEQDQLEVGEVGFKLDLSLLQDETKNKTRVLIGSRWCLKSLSE